MNYRGALGTQISIPINPGVDLLIRDAEARGKLEGLRWGRSLWPLLFAAGFASGCLVALLYAVGLKP